MASQNPLNVDRNVLREREQRNRLSRYQAINDAGSSFSGHSQPLFTEPIKDNSQDELSQRIQNALPDYASIKDILVTDQSRELIGVAQRPNGMYPRNSSHYSHHSSSLHHSSSSSSHRQQATGSSSHSSQHKSLSSGHFSSSHHHNASFGHSVSSSNISNGLSSSQGSGSKQSATRDWPSKHQQHLKLHHISNVQSTTEHHKESPPSSHCQPQNARPSMGEVASQKPHLFPSLDTLLSNGTNAVTPKSSLSEPLLKDKETIENILQKMQLNVPSPLTAIQTPEKDASKTIYSFHDQEQLLDHFDSIVEDANQVNHSEETDIPRFKLDEDLQVSDSEDEQQNKLVLPYIKDPEETIKQESPSPPPLHHSSPSTGESSGSESEDSSSGSESDEAEPQATSLEPPPSKPTFQGWTLANFLDTSPAELKLASGATAQSPNSSPSVGEAPEPLISSSPSKLKRSASPASPPLPINDASLPRTKRTKVSTSNSRQATPITFTADDTPRSPSPPPLPAVPPLPLENAPNLGDASLNGCQSLEVPISPLRKTNSLLEFKNIWVTIDLSLLDMLPPKLRNQVPSWRPYRKVPKLTPSPHPPPSEHITSHEDRKPSSPTPPPLHLPNLSTHSESSKVQDVMKRLKFEEKKDLNAHNFNKYSRERTKLKAAMAEGKESSSWKKKYSSQALRPNYPSLVEEGSCSPSPPILINGDCQSKGASASAAAPQQSKFASRSQYQYYMEESKRNKCLAEQETDKTKATLRHFDSIINYTQGIETMEKNSDSVKMYKFYKDNLSIVRYVESTLIRGERMALSVLCYRYKAFLLYKMYYYKRPDINELQRKLIELQRFRPPTGSTSSPALSQRSPLNGGCGLSSGSNLGNHSPTPSPAGSVGSQSSGYSSSELNNPLPRSGTSGSTPDAVHTCVQQLNYYLLNIHKALDNWERAKVIASRCSSSDKEIINEVDDQFERPLDLLHWSSSDIIRYATKFVLAMRQRQQQS